MTRTAKLSFPAARRARISHHETELDAAATRLREARAEDPDSRRAVLADWMWRNARLRLLAARHGTDYQPLPVPA